MNNSGTSDKDVVTIDLMKLVRLLWHHIVLILCVAVLCALAGFCVANFFVTPSYSASADMIVNNSQESTSVTTVSNSDLSASSSLVSTYSVILKSHTVMERVIDQLDLDTTSTDLAKCISVSSVNDTQVMRITVKRDNAMEALAIVSCIVDLAPEVIIDVVEAGSVKTVDAPYTTGEKVSPSRTRYAAVAGVLGLVACVVVLVVRELLNNTVKTEEDLRNLTELPVLGVIPMEGTGQNRKQPRRNSRSRNKRRAG